MRTNNWRNISALLVADFISCAMPSCSGDDVPTTIESAQPGSSVYELNEAEDIALTSRNR